MQPPWHTTPQALVILTKMPRPAIKHYEHQYPLNTDRWAEYEGRDVNKLVALFALHISDRDAMVPYPTDRVVMPSALLGALFGDPMGNPGTESAWRTHWDNSDEWAAIRAEVRTALHKAIGEGRQIQKDRQMESVW
jgi:hypothetical protein